MSDREGQSRGPASGDATPERDAGAPCAVAGIPFTARSPFWGPSGNAAGRHWATEYIGLPWVAGGRGPTQFDCWGLFLAIQRERFGRVLPEIPLDADDLALLARAFRDHPERRRWERVALPAEGDAVLLRRSRHPVHVGVWLAADGGGVLHCVKGAGVVFQRLPELELHGWRIEGYYRSTH